MSDAGSTSGSDISVTSPDVGPHEDAVTQVPDVEILPEPWPENAELDSLILQTMSDAHLPGLAACVTREGLVQWCGGYGAAHVDKGLPVTEHTPFMIASISKTVVAMVAMQHWERHLFDLMEDISNVTAFEVTNPAFPEKAITFHQLLTHTSSIRDNWNAMGTFYSYGADPALSLGDAVASYFSPDGALYNASSNFYAEEPGTVNHYSNMAIALLAHGLEVVGEEAFDAYCDAEIFEPLGMENTSWRLADFAPDQIAMPYNYSGGAFVEEGHYTFADYPDGGLFTSAYDLSRFLNLHASEGMWDGQALLEPETVAMMLTPQVPQLAANQGIVWRVWTMDGALWAGHEGAEAGVATLMEYRLSDGLGVVLLMNGNWPSPATAIYALVDALKDWGETL